MPYDWSSSPNLVSPILDLNMTVSSDVSDGLSKIISLPDIDSISSLRCAVEIEYHEFCRDIS